MAPTDMPSSHPTVEPTQTPTDEPSVHPTLTPTSNPTLHPSSSPSLNPTTDQPSQNPTMYSDGTLLQNGCPSDYPERYPGTNRCFGFFGETLVAILIQSTTLQAIMHQT